MYYFFYFFIFYQLVRIIYRKFKESDLGSKITIQKLDEKIIKSREKIQKSNQKIFKSKNRHIIEIDEIDIVNDYNSRCVMNSSRCVFSKTDDFSIIDKMKEKRPDVLQLPKSTLTWEGKTYVPSKNYK